LIDGLKAAREGQALSSHGRQVPRLGIRVTHKGTKTYGKVFIVTR
jgi:hypothetical protein